MFLRQCCLYFRMFVDACISLTSYMFSTFVYQLIVVAGLNHGRRHIIIITGAAGQGAKK